MHMAALTVIAMAALLTTAAHAEPLPLPKPTGPGGPCPDAWVSSGSFCVPPQRGQDAFAKPLNGTCPIWMDFERQLLLAQ
jgi:hypothetical protein